MQAAVPYMERIVDAKEQLDKINAKLDVPLMLDAGSLEKYEASFKALEAIEAEYKK